MEVHQSSPILIVLVLVMLWVRVLHNLIVAVHSERRIHLLGPEYLAWLVVCQLFLILDYDLPYALLLRLLKHVGNRFVYPYENILEGFRYVRHTWITQIVFSNKLVEIDSWLDGLALLVE